MLFWFFLSIKWVFSDIKEILNCRQEDDIESGKYNTMNSEKGMTYNLLTNIIKMQPYKYSLPIEIIKLT